MADTSQQALSEPHTNGVMDGLTEEEKSKMRPADIDAVSLYSFNIFLQIYWANASLIIFLMIKI